MATVIGIFEDLYTNKKPLTVVKPGTQTRRFTHISDTINVCYLAWKKITVPITVFLTRKLFNLKVAKMFKSKIKFLNLEKVKDMRQL